MSAPAGAEVAAPAVERAAGFRERLLAMRVQPQHVALAGVLGLSAALNTYRLAQNGYANVFYSAGVKSMLRSLHNFVFVSFDPGGLISVDKPPLGLWLQVASAKVFGFSPLSLLLPEAILGVLAVALLYRLVASRTGPLAGCRAERFSHSCRLSLFTHRKIVQERIFISTLRAFTTFAFGITTRCTAFLLRLRKSFFRLR